MVLHRGRRIRSRLSFEALFGPGRSRGPLRHLVSRIADVLRVRHARLESGIQTGCIEREDAVPDVDMLGKALGGGIVPLSAVLSRNDVMGVITPGSHGSTFGGNPLAVAVGHAVVGLLETGEFQEGARVLGERLRSRLEPLVGSRGSPRFAP